MSETIKAIVITGSPATGKRTVGRLMAKIMGLELIELNRLAVEEGCVTGRTGDELVVDARGLRRSLTSKMASKRLVVVGHLGPEVLEEGEVEKAFVLREDPGVLRERYLARGYSQGKTRENILVEVLDVCLHRALERFGSGKVFEIPSHGRDPESIVLEIRDIIEGRSKKTRERARWLEQVSSANNLRRLLE